MRVAPRTHDSACSYATSAAPPSTAHPDAKQTSTSLPLCTLPPATPSRTAPPPLPMYRAPPSAGARTHQHWTCVPNLNAVAQQAWLPRAKCNATCHHNATNARPQAAACLLSALRAHCEQHCRPPATLTLQRYAVLPCLNRGMEALPWDGNPQPSHTHHSQQTQLLGTALATIQAGLLALAMQQPTHVAGCGGLWGSGTAAQAFGSAGQTPAKETTGSQPRRHTGTLSSPLQRATVCC